MNKINEADSANNYATVELTKTKGKGTDSLAGFPDEEEKIAAHYVSASGWQGPPNLPHNEKFYASAPGFKSEIHKQK